jgi:hypothetical protein
LSPDRTLVLIRERSFLELLDLALVVVRRRPGVLGATAAIGIAPFAAVGAWLASRPLPGGLWLAAVAVVAPWSTAPLTVVLGGLMFNERPTAGRVARTIGRAWPRMLLYHGLVRPLLILTVVLVPLIPARLAFLDEVILLERSRGVAAARQTVARRCGNLCRRRGGELFNQWLGRLAFGALFVLAFRWGVEAVVDALTVGLSWESPDDEPGGPLVAAARWAVDVRAWTAQVGIWIAVAFFAVARFLAYVDQRIRMEGWEVELRLRAAGAALEEGRW